MNKVLKMLQDGIEDAGCVNSEEFKLFARRFRAGLTRELNQVGGKDLKFNVGHYEVSGFFTVDRPYYFSFNERNPKLGFLIRTAENYSDYTGGINQFLTLREGMLKDYFARILCK